MIRTVIGIDGMMCPMCEAHINDAIRNRFSVKSVSSSHKKGQTTILSETAPDEKALREAIEGTGYRVLDVHSEESEKKCFSLFKK